jgi:hypothetical protein
VAQEKLGIEPMLDAADMCNPNPEARPDEQCIITYLSQFPKAFLSITHSLPPIPTRASVTTSDTHSAGFSQAAPLDHGVSTGSSSSSLSQTDLASAFPSTPPFTATYGEFAQPQTAGFSDANTGYGSLSSVATASSMTAAGWPTSSDVTPHGSSSPTLESSLPLPTRPLPKPTKALPAFPGADAYASKPLPEQPMPQSASLDSLRAALHQAPFSYPTEPQHSQYSSTPQTAQLHSGQQAQQYGMATPATPQHGEYSSAMQQQDAYSAGLAAHNPYYGGAPAGGASQQHDDELARREAEWQRKEDEWRRKEAEMQQMMEQLAARQNALAANAGGMYQFEMRMV